MFFIGGGGIIGLAILLFLLITSRAIWILCNDHTDYIIQTPTEPVQPENTNNNINVNISASLYESLDWKEINGKNTPKL